MHIHMYIYIYKYIHISIQIYTHTYVYVCIYNLPLVTVISENLNAYNLQGVNVAWGNRGGSGAATNKWSPLG
jgi:hypothetical protein